MNVPYILTTVLPPILTALTSMDISSAVVTVNLRETQLFAKVESLQHVLFQ